MGCGNRLRGSGWCGAVDGRGRGCNSRRGARHDGHGNAAGQPVEADGDKLGVEDAELPDQHQVGQETAGGSAKGIGAVEQADPPSGQIQAMGYREPDQQGQGAAHQQSGRCQQQQGDGVAQHQGGKAELEPSLGAGDVGRSPGGQLRELRQDEGDAETPAADEELRPTVET